MNVKTIERNSTQVFDELESNVRSYCRRFPVVFSTAKNALVFDETARCYIDFLAGAGALNYGHNNPRLRERLVEHLLTDGITQSLDLHTSSKRDFLQRFHDIVLAPRSMSYRIQFPGPTGTNAVEAALKLARKVTGRKNVVAFTNAFHGMTLGSLAVSARASKRAGAGVALPDVIRMPYDCYFGPDIDTLAYIEAMLFKPGSGIDLPAAMILETLQAEGGLNVARHTWLQGLAELARQHAVLLIVDDIQTGCGRTGSFFSFEHAELQPDIVCLSKSISGYGLPLSLVLIKPTLDQWQPGEHNGTFRGNNLAFIAASAALSYWENDEFSRDIQLKSQTITLQLNDIARRYGEHITEVRGLGMLQGLAFRDPETAQNAASEAFSHGLVIELCGASENVLKVMPPLTIEHDVLADGLQRMTYAIDKILN